MTPEQRQTLQSKPLERMRRFASLLNWRGIELEWIVFEPSEREKNDTIPTSGIIAFYLTPDIKFNLQINESPSGQSVTHQATIKASRYGIRDIGWHPFT